MSPTYLYVKKKKTDSDSDFGLSVQGFLEWNLYTLKKCWVKYKPALGKIWTNTAIGLFWPSSWVEGWVEHLTQPLGQNNPVAVFVHICI